MHIYRMYWRRTFRKPGSIFLWLLLPFVFMTIYELAFGGDDVIPRTGLAIVDQDSSFVSRLVGGAFGQGPVADLIDIIPAANMEHVETLFRDEKASAALVLPKGLADSLLQVAPVTLTMYENPRHFIGPQIAAGVTGTLVTMGNGLLHMFEEPIRGIQSVTEAGEATAADDVAEIAKMIYTLGEDAPNLGAFASINVVVVEADTDEDDGLGDYNMASLFFPGLLMFGMLSVSLSLEARFLYDRKNLVTHRFVSAPIRASSILWQQRIYSASFLYVVTIVAAVLGGVIWQIPPNGLWTVNVIAIALILFIVGINGTIFSLSRSIKATSAISSFVMMALVIVGGGFFPAEFTGDAMSSIARLTPAGMANIALTETLTGRAHSGSIPVLYAYSMLFFAISLVAGRRRLI